jgi:hypothetical protein
MSTCACAQARPRSGPWSGFAKSHPEYVHVDLDFGADKDEKKLVVATEKDENKRAPLAEASTSCGEACPSIIIIESSDKEMEDAFWASVAQSFDEK